jgi:hypothetical protein
LLATSTFEPCVVVDHSKVTAHSARDVLNHKNTSVDRTTTPACRSAGTERTMRSPARCVRSVVLVGRSVPRHAGCVHVLHKGRVPTSANHVWRSTLQWQNIQASAPCGACVDSSLEYGWLGCYSPNGEGGRALLVPASLRVQPQIETSALHVAVRGCPRTGIDACTTRLWSLATHTHTCMLAHICSVLHAARMAWPARSTSMAVKA